MSSKIVNLNIIQWEQEKLIILRYVIELNGKSNNKDSRKIIKC